MYLTMFTCYFHQTRNYHIWNELLNHWVLISKKGRLEYKQRIPLFKRIDVFLPCMISLLKTWTSFLRYYAGSFSATEYSNNRYMNAVCIHGNVLLKTRTAFVYRFRNMIEILVALYYILISLVFLGLHREGHTILDP